MQYGCKVSSNSTKPFEQCQNFPTVLEAYEQNQDFPTVITNSEKYQNCPTIQQSKKTLQHYKHSMTVLKLQY